jgi:hypothetical protein
VKLVDVTLVAFPALGAAGVGANVGVGVGVAVAVGVGVGDGGGVLGVGVGVGVKATVALGVAVAVTVGVGLGLGGKLGVGLAIGVGLGEGAVIMSPVPELVAPKPVAAQSAVKPVSLGGPDPSQVNSGRFAPTMCKTQLLGPVFPVTFTAT